MLGSTPIAVTRAASREHHAGDLPTCGANRDADADLPRTPGDGVRHYSVEPDGSQQQSKQSRRAHEQRAHLARKKRQPDAGEQCVDLRAGHRLDLV